MSSCPCAAIGTTPRARTHDAPHLKRCPTCSAVFSDATTFCENDGEYLVEDDDEMHEGEPSRRTAALLPTMPVAPPPPDVPMVASGAPIAESLGRSPTSGALSAVIADALAIARSFEAHSLAWQPQPEDFVRSDDGRVALTQARGVCKRTSPFDARSVLRALGEALAPVPLVLADTSLVRALIMPRRAPLGLAQAAEEISSASVAVRATGSAALDVGFARERQEDTAFATSNGDARIAVLCDGVSLSADGGLASRVGAETAFAFAQQHITESTDDSVTARDAIRAAHDAVCKRVSELDTGEDETDDTDPPGSTIVVAIVRGTALSVAWLGDSRAYVVGEAGSALVTRDHSWKNEVERLGYEGDPSAMGNLGNALTRCIGPLEAGMQMEVDPDVVTGTLVAGQTLVVCSDGLWSYFPDAPLLGKLVAFHDGATEEELAVRLVNHALVAGGEDNVSVVVFRGRG